MCSAHPGAISWIFMAFGNTDKEARGEKRRRPTKDPVRQFHERIKKFGIKLGSRIPPDPKYAKEVIGRMVQISQPSSSPGSSRRTKTR